MKYPAIGLVALFLRSLAETLEKNNESNIIAPNLEEPVSPRPQAGARPKGSDEAHYSFPSAPAPDKPTRTRRTRAQIAADEAAASQQTVSGVNAGDKDLVELEKKFDLASPPLEPVKLYPDKSDEDLYQERRASFAEYIKNGGSSELERVKAVAAKYNLTQGNRGISREDHAAFLADIEALKL